MSLNISDLTYTITSFDSTNSPVVHFGCDGHSETLASCPTDTADNAKAYLDTYVAAYIAGKVQEELTAQQNAVDPSVQALLNQTQTAEA